LKFLANNIFVLVFWIGILDWLIYKIQFNNDYNPFQKIFWAFPPKRRAGFSLQSVIAGTKHSVEYIAS